MLMSAAGVAAAGGSALYTYAPWLNYEEQADLARRPAKDAASPDMREVIRLATLAASGHNTQPWIFVTRPDAIEVHPDYTRRLPAVDPDDRELWISLGCALENLLIAAHGSGLATEITYPGPADFIRVQLTAERQKTSPLLAAIPLRQNTRSEYDGKAVDRTDLAKLRSLPLEPDVLLHFVLEPPGLNMLADFVRQGSLVQYADQAFMTELIQWLRFNRREALHSLDGLYSGCTGNPEVPRWLGQWVVSGSKPQPQADADIQKLRSSAGAIVIATAVENKTAWVRAGQVYERLALTMTTLGLKLAFLNQPIEASALRAQFEMAMGLGERRAQLLIRFGYAQRMPRSLRRPVLQVLRAS